MTYAHLVELALSVVITGYLIIASSSRKGSDQW